MWLGAKLEVHANHGILFIAHNSIEVWAWKVCSPIHPDSHTLWLMLYQPKAPCKAPSKGEPQ